MTESLPSGLRPVEAGQAGLTHLHAPATRVSPEDTRLFAAMMLSPGPQSSGPRSGVEGLGETARAVATRLAGDGRSFDDLRQSMFQSVDLRDPIGTMFAMTEHSMEAHALFTRLHIATGLAGAATTLFGTLLRSQS